MCAWVVCTLYVVREKTMINCDGQRYGCGANEE